MRKTVIFTALIIILLVPAVCMGDHFPAQLTNRKIENTGDEVKPDADRELEGVERTIVNLKSGKREITGVLLRPVEKPAALLPGILFLWAPGSSLSDRETVTAQLARKGYAVLLTDWKDHAGAALSYEYLEKTPDVDETSITIMGVHEGGTEAILLGCEKRNKVKAVVSVAAHPPYDMPGKDPAGTIWAPVLLVHGEADRQVPVSVSQYFYYNLKDKNRITEVFFLPFASYRFNLTEWSQVTVEVDKFIRKYVLTVPPDKKYDQMDYRREIKNK